MKEAEHLAEKAPATSATMNVPAATVAANASSEGVKTGEVTLTLQPSGDQEVKATMIAGEEFDFSRYPHNNRESRSRPPRT